MSGFKTEGAESPFDDTEEQTDNASTQPEDSGSIDEARSEDDVDETTGDAMPRIPYVKKRRMEEETTQWLRDRLTFYVREKVDRGERTLIADAENEFDRDIPKFDVREAAYLAAQEHPELVYEQLEEMGYDRE